MQFACSQTNGKINTKVRSEKREELRKKVFHFSGARFLQSSSHTNTYTAAHLEPLMQRRDMIRMHRAIRNQASDSRLVEFNKKFKQLFKMGPIWGHEVNLFKLKTSLKWTLLCRCPYIYNLQPTHRQSGF